MKIRTPEQLSDKLSQELAWRKIELSSMKALIDLKPTSSRKNVLLRSGITMLYAHWEGFVKVAANSYLEFVAMQGLPYNQLSNTFIALAMKDKLDRASETNKVIIYSEIADFFMTKLSKRSIIRYENRIATSNLSSAVFKEIVCMLGLDYKFYESKEVLIDEKLLKRRNQIAHGNYLDVDEKEYDQLHMQVVAIIETFRNQIDNCVATKQYCC